MNKSELIQALVEKSGVSKVPATAVLDALTEIVSDVLKAKRNVVLTGFGTFAVKEKPARVGRNPGTGEAINLKASTAPVFKAGIVLKRAVN